MLTINGNILAKDFNDEILVNGINVWNQDAMQFSLYTLVDASNDIKNELGIKEEYQYDLSDPYVSDPLNSYMKPHMDVKKISNSSEIILVFPFQCGIKYAPGYHLLNIRDCIGVTTLEELQKAWKGEA